MNTVQEIRSQLEEIVRLTKLGRTETAAHQIDLLDRDRLRPMQKPAAAGDTVNLLDPALSTSMYLTVARRDLDAGDGDAALISLEQALAAWTRSV